METKKLEICVFFFSYNEIHSVRGAVLLFELFICSGCRVSTSIIFLKFRLMTERHVTLTELQTKRNDFYPFLRKAVIENEVIVEGH